MDHAMRGVCDQLQEYILRNTRPLRAAPWTALRSRRSFAQTAFRISLNHLSLPEIEDFNALGDA